MDSLIRQRWISEANKICRGISMRSIKIKLPRLVLVPCLVFAANYGGLAEGAERPLDVYLFWAEGASIAQMKLTLFGNGQAKNHKCVYSIWK
jgi:hypothetical protein